MGESILFSIKDSIQMYAQVISTVLEMDVDIVDEHMIRVAGTEKFSGGINKPIDNEGKAFKKVIETKQTLVVEVPGQDEVCLSCSNRFDCKEEFEICCPIILDNQVIGVISLAVFDNEKKQDIIKKRDNFVLFLEQISNLIAAKAAEYMRFKEQAFSLELLKRLIDCISEGVIVFDNSQHILHINKKSEKILGNNLQQLIYLKRIKEFAIHKQRKASSFNEVEFIVRVRSKKISLVGNIHPIMVDGAEVGSVFVFQDVTVINRNLLQSQNMKNFTFEHIIGQEENFIKVKETARKMAYNNENLLIYGETGTGKEIFARAIHNESNRKEKPFMTIICSGTVESVLEKEIFGYNFEPNEDEKPGKIHLVRGGTLFIDEICDLTLRLQARLMQIIQNKKDFDILFIAATSQDLKSKVANGEFRKDLYYTLMAFNIVIPPVRSRTNDIPLLIEYFLGKYCRLEGKKVDLSEDVFRLMRQYSWPGNVREIERIVSFIVNTQNDRALVKVENLPDMIRNQLTEFSAGQYNLERLEKNTILQVLNAFGNTAESKRKAAQELGISIATLYRKLDKFGIKEMKQYDIFS